MTFDGGAVDNLGAIDAGADGVIAFDQDTVTNEAGGVIDCVEGAQVRLIKDGQTVARTTTDNYGDFKFDRLDDNSGRYTVEVVSGDKSKMLDATLGTSVFLGEIRL